MLQLLTAVYNWSTGTCERRPVRTSAANPPRRSEMASSTRPRGLPQPSADTPCEETQVARGTMVFPSPLSQMPYECSRRAEHETGVPYVQTDAESNLACMELPIYYRVEVFPPAPDTECILIATRNRRLFNQGGDGITAYGSVNRTDFQFRTGVYNGWPRTKRHCRGALLRQAEWNEMSMAISKTRATYWINGTRIATADLGDYLPSTELFLGVISYQSEFRVRRLDVSRDPQLLREVCSEAEIRLAAPLKEKVITLHAVPSPCEGERHDAIDVVCTNIAGENVATIACLTPTTSLGDVRSRLAEGLNEYTIVQILLPDGTLLQRGSDSTPLSSILQGSAASKQ